MANIVCPVNDGELYIYVLWFIVDMTGLNRTDAYKAHD